MGVSVYSRVNTGPHVERLRAIMPKKGAKEDGER